MSRIFLSHSSANNAEAVALRDWLEREGWKDEVFLDIDSMRGIAAGERWERRRSSSCAHRRAAPGCDRMLAGRCRIYCARHSNQSRRTQREHREESM